MRRGAQIAAVSACGVAGFLCAALLALVPVAGADDGTGTTSTTPTTPTDTTTTTTVPTTDGTTTTAPPAPRPTPRPRGPKLIAAGVPVGGTLVGGLTAAEAKKIVKERFAKPLKLVVTPGAKVVFTPQELGAAAHLKEAITLAVRVKRAGFVVPLKVDVQRPKVERLVAHLAKQYRREPIDAQLRIRDLKPFATKEVPGRRVKEVIAMRTIVKALKTHERTPVQLPLDEIKPAVTANDLGRAIVIRRGSKELLLYKVANEPKLIREFKVATGRSEYPTPLGKFEIITKQENPWWYPPTTSAWAQGQEPVPPGPGNPLGTRWMGISSPYVGIHGTPDAASIGYSASHGCIRMLIPQVEWLFTKVDVGTPVFIVAA
ncbi:MAG: L,D-transpeptidase family protein [Gaiellaceae bacterium]